MTRFDLNSEAWNAKFIERDEREEEKRIRIEEKIARQSEPSVRLIL
jgi:hypothetical protein